MAFEQREIGVLLGLQIVEGDALEIGDDEPARHFLFASGIDEATDVFHALGVGFVEVLACGFLLYEQAAGPKEVDFPPGAGKFFHGLLEGGDGAAFDAEDVEKVIPERLAVAAFRARVFVFARKGNRAAFDFIPGKHAFFSSEKLSS